MLLGRRSVRRSPRLPLRALAPWLVAGPVVAVLAGHVRDWFVMTDELFYERLALSVDRTHSPLPEIHGVLVPNVNQLYPLLLAVVYARGSIGVDLQVAHVVGALVMTSAAIPAALLARRLAASGWAALAAGLLTAAVPWIVLSSFLLTEVVAYPAAVWTLLALHTALERPSARHDAAALAVLAVAVLARLQLLVFGAVLVAAILVQEWREAEPRRHAARARATLLRSWERHRVVAVGALAAVAGLAGLAAAGRSSAVLGTYGVTLTRGSFGAGVLGHGLEALAVVGVGVGIVPFVVGGAWLCSSLRESASGGERAFALIGVLTIVAFTLEVGSFDLGFGHSFVQERYLFYVAPVLLIGLCSAAGRFPPAPFLAVPLVLFAAGIHFWTLESFAKLNLDTPVSFMANYLVRTFGGGTGARLFLVAVALVAAAAAVELRLLGGARLATTVLVAVTLVAVPAETAAVYARLFGTAANGQPLTTTTRPLSVDQSDTFSWIDQFFDGGSSAEVTAITYPMVVGDYFASAAFAWDLQFWNRAVTGVAQLGHEFDWTPSTFAKLHLRFDPRTGASNLTRPGYVAQALGDARFQLAGTVVFNGRNVLLIDPDRPWRATWVGEGLYDDGWTKPDRVARIRVFAAPGQQSSSKRLLQLTLQAPTGPPRTATVSSNSGRWRLTLPPNVPVEQDVAVCVPPTGSAALSLRVAGATTIYGDPESEQRFLLPRRAGALVQRVYLSGETQGAC